MTTRVRGSAFNFGDQGAFHSALDHGCRITSSAAVNRLAMIAALEIIDDEGGGVLLVPQGISHNFDAAVDFPVTANPLCVWELTGNSFKLQGNQAVAGQVKGSLTLTKNLTVGEHAALNGQRCASKQIIAPATGAAIQIADLTQHLVLNHAATIANLTVVLPQTPMDGCIVRISSRSIVTALTLSASAGSTIEAGHGATTLAVQQAIEYIYDTASTKWYRS